MHLYVCPQERLDNDDQCVGTEGLSASALCNCHIRIVCHSTGSSQEHQALCRTLLLPFFSVPYGHTIRLLELTVLVTHFVPSPRALYATLRLFLVRTIY